MSYHILYPHFILPNSKNTTCAFTQKARKFAKMMTMYNHTVYFYGHEDSEVCCTELVSVLTKNDFLNAYGIEPDWNDPKYISDCINDKNEDIKISEIYYSKLLIEIMKRGKKNDFICSFWGFPDILRSLKQSHGMILVEPGIGCPQTFADFCAYESYAIMHNIYGLRNIQPKCYDAVIPNYFDLDEFIISDDIGVNGYDEIENKPFQYFLFLGRIINIKGIEIIIEMAKALPEENFVFVGPGNVNFCTTSNVYIYPPVGVSGRTKWMSNTKGFILPTLYVEPFGGSTIEAMLCGTPVIASDWGVFNETIIHGYTGYRCRLIEHFVFAAKNIDKIDRNICKQWAEQNYSLQAIYPLFKEWFSMLKRLHTTENEIILDYYASNDERTEMDWLRKKYPFPCIEPKLPKHIIKKKVAIYTETKWAFGTIYNGLVKAFENSFKFSLELFDWNREYPSDNFLSYDIVLTTTWDTAKLFENIYYTKRPILFTGHGLVEFVNHTFDKIQKVNITSEDVAKFKLEDKLQNYLKDKTFSVVSVELLNLFTTKYNFKNVFYTPCGIDKKIFKPSLEKNKGKKLRVIHMHLKGGRNDAHGYNVKRMYLIEKIRSLCGDKIEFISPLEHEIIIPGSDMRNFYIKGDVYLCVSHSEGNPLGPMEAAACGLTIITTDIGEMSSFIDNGKDGFLITEKDEDKIVDKFVNYLIFLDDNRQVLQSMKKKLYEKTIKTRDWKIVSKHWETFFEEYTK